MTRSSRGLVLALATLAASACVPAGQNLAPEAMHDLWLLHSYGSSYFDGALAPSGRKEKLEREVQARGLMTAQDVMLAQQQKFQIGGSMAATMVVARYIPKAFGVAQRTPGLELLIYDTGLHQATQEDEFFFQNGRLIGWNYTAVNQQAASVHRTTQGRTFNRNEFTVTPCTKLGDSPCSGLRIAKPAPAGKGSF